MTERPILQPVLLALVAFGITLGSAMAWGALFDEVTNPPSTSNTLPATPTGGPPSPTAMTKPVATFEHSHSNPTRGSMFQMAVHSAASETQEVARAVHNLLARNPSD